MVSVDLLMKPQKCRVGPPGAAAGSGFFVGGFIWSCFGYIENYFDLFYFTFRISADFDEVGWHDNKTFPV